MGKLRPDLSGALFYFLIEKIKKAGTEGGNCRHKNFSNYPYFSNTFPYPCHRVR